MITTEQYQRLLPYKGYIQNRTAHGDVGPALSTIYAEHGQHVNWGCGACVESMFNFFQSVISDYERENPETT
jgi:hypothetical protein